MVVRLAPVSGPILSMVPPWFGQTRMKSEQDVADLAQFRRPPLWG
jgi:hypothetical protein